MKPWGLLHFHVVAAPLLFFCNVMDVFVSIWTLFLWTFAASRGSTQQRFVGSRLGNCAMCRDEDQRDRCGRKQIMWWIDPGVKWCHSTLKNPINKSAGVRVWIHTLITANFLLCEKVNGKMVQGTVVHTAVLPHQQHQQGWSLGVVSTTRCAGTFILDGVWCSQTWP